MPDNIYHHCYKDREDSGHKGREEKNKGKKYLEFKKSKHDRDKYQWLERDLHIPKDSKKHESLEKGDDGDNHTKPKEFSEDKLIPTNRFRKDEKYRFSLYLLKQELASYKKNRDESKNFNHRESKINDDFISFSKSKPIKQNRKKCKNGSKKDDDIQKFISDDFSKCILSDVQHTIQTYNLKIVYFR